MTRINCDLEPSELTDQHLMAEYRELPMVFGSLKRSLKAQPLNSLLKKIPKNYTLNTGHVTFFYNKLKFLELRYNRLRDELKKRNYNLDDNRNLDLDSFPRILYNDWSDSKRDREILFERLKIRIAEKPNWYRYYSKPIDDNFIMRYTND